MKTKKVIKTAILLFLFTACFAQAALVPYGRNEDSNLEDDIDETAICTLCHLIIGFKKLIDYGLMIMLFISFTGLVVAAVMYIVSGGSEQMINTAKSFIRNILYGFGIVLGAWLMIYVVMTYFGVKRAGDADGALGIEKTSWNTFTCQTDSTAGDLYPGPN